MGQSANPSAMISPPDFSLPAAQLAMQSDLGRQQLAQRDRLLGFATRMPLESWTPDIFGESGLQNKAAQIAAINAFKSKQYEQQTNPEMAALREELPRRMLEDAQGNNWQRQMGDWARNVGLTKMLTTGLQDSTVGKSGFFDDATLQGQAFKQAQLQRAQNYLAANPATQVGIDPASILQAENASQIRNMQQRDAYRNAMLGQAQGAAQSTTDWINKMLASSSTAVEAGRQDWQNYQQAMLRAAQNKADRDNALMGGGMQAGGNILGSLIGSGQLGGSGGGGGMFGSFGNMFGGSGAENAAAAI